MNSNNKNLIKFTQYLKEVCPNPKCLLTFNNDYEFLIKVMLSAQCKDTEVNKYADVLFKKYNSLKKLQEASLKDIEKYIEHLGFHKAKALNIKDIVNSLIKKFDCKVPDNKKDLMSMRGVGNKTANCILNEIYHQPFIAVDTHVQRVCKRLGFAKLEDLPEEIEQSLYKNLPEEEKVHFSNRTIWFGRNICTAKKPSCFQCKMKAFCRVQKLR